MYKMKWEHNYSWARLIMMFVLLCNFVIIALSLFSYNPHDLSFFYTSSHVAPASNICGAFGAQLAAVLVYLFGGASFLLLLSIASTLFMIATKRRIKNEWERIGATFFLVVCVSALLHYYSVDFFPHVYPGGAIGALFLQKLVYCFDVFGAQIFLTMGLCATFVLLTRFFFMPLIYSIEKVVVYLIVIAQQYKVVQRGGFAVLMLFQFIFIRPLLFIVSFIRSLRDGSAFDSTGLVAQDYDDEQESLSDVLQLDHVQTESDYSLSDGTDEDEFDTSFVADTYTADAVTADIDTCIETGNHYELPKISTRTSERGAHDFHSIDPQLDERAQILEDKLKRFGICGKVVAIKRGPVVTLFEYQPDENTKLSKIISLEDDLAMALTALSIRIIAPIPGRSVVGFEVSNTKRNEVLFSQLIESREYVKFEGLLPLVLGKDTIGETVVVDLARMPHLLIAGSTGSGKSVALNTMLISLLCALDPDQLKLILIDPKRLEFAPYADIAHLLFPIVTNPILSIPILRWVVQEMERRYEKMAAVGARNLSDYNERIKNKNDEDALPFIVVVIDELADLMLTVGRDIEDLITRITQMARAAGIHMIVATQRPSVDVITGLIKANFPSRISFRVASRIDSRTILDTMGADRLLGRGDMLFLDATMSQLRRVHGAYVSEEEIAHVVSRIRQQRAVAYHEIHRELTEYVDDVSSADDALVKDVQKFLNEIDEVSISLLQRRFKIGYNRSARIIDMLENQGLIMPPDGGRTRKVIR